MPRIEEIIGSYTPLLRKGNEWEGVCPIEAHAEPLAVIGDTFRCYGCGAKGDALAFLRAVGEADPEGALSNGHIWTPTLTKPTPPPSRYAIERVLERPHPTVLVCDSLPAAKVAARLLLSYCVVAWPGGGSRWDGLEPLRGRKLLLWPSPANAAHMERLEAIVADPAGLACQGKIVAPLDLSEWTGTSEELIAWAKANVRPLKNPVGVVAGAVLANPPAGNGREQSTPSEAPPPPTGPVAEASGSDLSGSEPPPVRDADFPANAAKSKPSKRKPRLEVVGNTAIQPAAEDEPLPQAMSEDALADHFALQHGKDWRHVRAWNRWLEWDGGTWRTDETGKIDRLAVELTRQAIHWPEAGTLTPKEKRQVNKRSTAGAVRDLAATDRRMAATPDQWDADPMLLGVPGGVVDLRAAKLLEADREQFITKRCAVDPADGKPEIWLSYLDRCHMGNADIIGYLQRYAGYCCTGEIGEHALAFLYGSGRNGKGVFLETISRILGDYARTASIQTFLEQRNPAHSTELARLHKARLVITEEAGAGGRWNESRVKHMTGGGKITAHYMRMDDFEFLPNFKLLVAANHKPSLRSVDEAIKARIHLVPFNVTIPAEERDPYLLDKLQAEWPQILNWMLQGCLQWQERGLSPPQRILDATQEYMQSEDTLGDWIEQCCDLSGELDGASGYQNYAKWCGEQGHTAWSRIGWSKAVSDRPEFDSRRSNGRTIFIGLSLKIGQT